MYISASLLTKSMYIDYIKSCKGIPIYVQMYYIHVVHNYLIGIILPR